MRLLPDFHALHWLLLLSVASCTHKLQQELGKNCDGLLGYADWASQDHRHSISAYIFQINGENISWSCQKQNIVALSSIKAEFIALTHMMKETLWLQHFITEVIQPLKSFIWLYSDNQSTITIVYGNQQHARTKHFNIQLYFLCDTIERVKSHYNTCQPIKCWQISLQKGYLVWKSKA